MDLDVYTLSRLQFALTIMFHYLFPPLSIGLGWLMVIMEGMYLKTGNREYEAIARFWTGIFAVVFAWAWQPGSSWYLSLNQLVCLLSLCRDVFGSALAAEGISLSFWNPVFLLF